MDMAEIVRRAEELFQTSQGREAILFLRAELKKDRKSFERSKKFAQFALKHEKEITDLTDEEGKIRGTDDHS